MLQIFFLQLHVLLEAKAPNFSFRLCIEFFRVEEVEKAKKRKKRKRSEGADDREVKRKKVSKETGRKKKHVRFEDPTGKKKESKFEKTKNVTNFWRNSENAPSKPITVSLSTQCFSEVYDWKTRLKQFCDRNNATHFENKEESRKRSNKRKKKSKQKVTAMCRFSSEKLDEFPLHCLADLPQFSKPYFSSFRSAHVLQIFEFPVCLL